MRAALLVTSISFGCVGAAGADDVLIRTQRSGRQVITTLETVKAPAVGDKAGVAEGATVTGVVLKAFDWRCGRAFTDESGRRWRPARGPALSAYPNVIDGWVIVTKDGKTVFRSVSGSTYVAD